MNDDRLLALGTLAAELRPELHRYCARMTGSAADGEDVVQDSLARAHSALSEMPETPDSLRAWLFRVAHNAALDHLRRAKVRRGEPLDPDDDRLEDPALDPEDRIAQAEAARLALGRFCELPPLQRSVVIMKDVLGHSLSEIGAMLELSLPAVKSALHRGREGVKALRDATAGDGGDARAFSPLVRRYATLFGARDWDGVRAMLTEDVQLDLVSRAKRSGREVHGYFSNYEATPGWRVAPARIDGVDGMAVFRDAGDDRPSYFVVLEFDGDRVAFIKDFRYVPYIAGEARIELV